MKFSLNRKIQTDPKTALLNLKPSNLTSAQFKLIRQLLTAAKQTLAKAWKSPNLSVTEVLNRTNNAMTHAKMSAIDTDTITKFEQTWEPWLTHMLPNAFNKDVMMPWWLSHCNRQYASYSVTETPGLVLQTPHPYPLPPPFPSPCLTF